MIKSWKELKFYQKADDIMNEQVFPQSFLKRLLMPSIIRNYLRVMRYLEYFDYKKDNNKFFLPFWFYYRLRYEKLKMKTGFDIPIGCLGYGARIAHLSPIVINGNTKIGNFCCFSNNIVFADAQEKNIGDDVFIGSNVVFAKKINVADGCKISSSSLQNKCADVPNMLWGGVISVPIKPCIPWTESEPYKTEKKKVLDYLKKYNLKG